LIIAIFNDGWVIEVLMEVVDILQDRQLAGDNDIVDRGDVLGVLWETDAARVRDDWNVEPRGTSLSYYGRVKCKPEIKE
jgi:hypothetical protein